MPRPLPSRSCSAACLFSDRLLLRDALREGRVPRWAPREESERRALADAGLLLLCTPFRAERCMAVRRSDWIRASFNCRASVSSATASGNRSWWSGGATRELPAAALRTLDPELAVRAPSLNTNSCVAKPWPTVEDKSPTHRPRAVVSVSRVLLCPSPPGREPL